MAMPKIKKLLVSRNALPCPECGRMAKRHKQATHWVRDIGIKGPIILEITQSIHRCVPCGRAFPAAVNVTPPKTKFTWRVIKTALDYLDRDGETLQSTRDYMGAKYNVMLALSTLCDWKARYGEFKILTDIDGGHL